MRCTGRSCDPLAQVRPIRRRDTPESQTSMSKVNVSFGLLLKPRSARARVGWTRFLFEDKDSSLIVYLGKLHRDQDGLPPEETDPHPDVFGFFVPVHEHFLRGPDLLPQRIVDCVPAATYRWRRRISACDASITCLRHAAHRSPA